MHDTCVITEYSLPFQLLQELIRITSPLPACLVLPVGLFPQSRPQKKLLHVTCYPLFGSDDPSDIVSSRQTIILERITAKSTLQSPRILAFGVCLFMIGQRCQSSHSSLFFTHHCPVNGEPRSMYGSGDCRRAHPAIGHCSALGNRE
jgi:hypothetical protein